MHNIFRMSDLNESYFNPFSPLLVNVVNGWPLEFIDDDGKGVRHQSFVIKLARVEP